MNILFLSVDFYLVIILTRLIQQSSSAFFFFFSFRNNLESLHWVVPYGNDVFMVTSFLATESGLFDSLERPLRPKENSFF